MKRMLINATQPEELRVAIVDGQRLENLDIEHGAREQKKSNVYKGVITRIEPSLEAAFVDYGADRHGFLPFKEIARDYLNGNKTQGGRMSVKDALREGQDIVVQVEKEERGNKGAALTTYISLAGRYLVLMPNNPRAGGVSRRIEGEDRAEVREAISQLEVPDGMGTIVRTAGVGRSAEELQWDLDYQVDIWKAIRKAAEERKAPFLIYQESNVIIRALRDYFRSDIGVIQIDEPSIYEQARQFIEQTMPQNLRKLKLYEDEVPLFSRFQIEHQIETAFEREVSLPSGGSLAIDHTEALISIDINSARATKGADIEETAFHTNLEAGDEIARQLRLRDIGGLIVVDFIDMMSNKHQREVESRLREAAKMDRARVQMGRISRFGLLEMSRQRLQPSLGESASVTCPRCLGHGTIRSLGSLSLTILRIVGEEAMKESTERVVANVPVQIAAYLLNEKREQLSTVEQRNQVHILVIPDPALETPHYRIERVRTTDREHASHERRSYELAGEAPDDRYVPPADEEQEPGEEPMVKSVSPSGPAPQPKQQGASQAAVEPQGSDSGSRPGWLARITRALFTAGEDENAHREQSADEPAAPSRSQSSGRGGQREQQPRSKGGDQGRGKRGDQQGESERSGRSRGGRNRRGGRGRNQQQRGDNKSEGKSAGSGPASKGEGPNRAKKGGGSGERGAAKRGARDDERESPAQALAARRAEAQDTANEAADSGGGPRNDAAQQRERSPRSEPKGSSDGAARGDGGASSPPQPGAGEQRDSDNPASGGQRSRSRGRSRRGGRRRRGGRNNQATGASGAGAGEGSEAAQGAAPGESSERQQASKTAAPSQSATTHATEAATAAPDGATRDDPSGGGHGDSDANSPATGRAGDSAAPDAQGERDASAPEKDATASHEAQTVSARQPSDFRRGVKSLAESPEASARESGEGASAESATPSPNTAAPPAQSAPDPEAAAPDSRARPPDGDDDEDGPGSTQSAGDDEATPASGRS